MSIFKDLLQSLLALMMLLHLRKFYLSLLKTIKLRN